MSNDSKPNTYQTFSQQIAAQSSKDIDRALEGDPRAKPHERIGGLVEQSSTISGEAYRGLVHSDWKQRARELGVDPDEPDDHQYWSALHMAQQFVESFKYHQPTPVQIQRISNIRNAHIACLKVILQNVEGSADRTAAIRKLHESMMTCNKAIVCERPVQP